MAATVSSVWAKPGAWALESEQHAEELKSEAQPPSGDFPTLAAAKTGKKKPKKQSLTDFLKAPAIHDDVPIDLPTAPRERTEEELQQARSRGFRNFSDNRESDRARAPREDRDLGPSRADEVDDWSRSKKGPSSFEGGRDREMGPSRADEVDDWSKGKRFVGGGGGGERRERVGFFNSSRADEVDNWAASKSFGSSDNRRERRVGFHATGPVSDSDNWGKNKVGLDNVSGGGGGGRPRLNLQPRTLPVEEIVVKSDESARKEVVEALVVTERKPKENPFGAARPREEVLKEKGQDWKDIDEKMEAIKIKEAQKMNTDVVGGARRREFGLGSGDEKTVRTWRKPDSPNGCPAAAPAAAASANGTAAPAHATSANGTAALAAAPNGTPAPALPIFGSFAEITMKGVKMAESTVKVPRDN